MQELLTQYISLPGGPRLAYEEAGQGEMTLLFVHGLGSTRKVWRRNLEELSPYYRCIAVDLPGYGDSAKENYAISLAFFAESLGRFVVALGLNHYVPVGHSMGGQTVLTALLGGWLLPDKAILFAPAGIEVFAEWERQSLRAVNKAAILRAQSADQIRRNFHYNFFQTPPDALFLLEERLALMEDSVGYDYYLQLTVDSVNAMLDAPVAHRLEALNLPVLVFFGEDDKLIPNRFLHPQETTTGIARQAKEAIPGSRVELLAEAGHFVQWERAVESAEIIKDFAGIPSATDDEGAEALIHSFYEAFTQGDIQHLMAAYHPEAVYYSPLTGELRGEALAGWWARLCADAAGNNEAILSHLDADDFRGHADWRMQYRYQGALVLVGGQADFQFDGGRIRRQTDDFSVWSWASQVEGWRAWSLGWSSYYQARLRERIRRSLH